MELLKQKIEELLTAGGFDFSVDLDSGVDVFFF